MPAATPYGSASPGSPYPLHRNSLDAHSKRVWGVAPLGDECVVSVSDDNSIIVREFRSKKQECRWHHKGAMSVAVSHDGKYVASGDRYGDLQLWDVESGGNFSGPWRLHVDKVWSVTWSPEGSRIASCSEDGTFIIWNARPYSRRGKPLLGPISTKQNAVYTIAYCPTGTKLVTGGRDSTIKIWDAETGHLQARLGGHAMSVVSLALTKNILVSGSSDHTVRVWDIGDSGRKAAKAVFKAILSDYTAIKHIAVSEHFFATASYKHIYLRSLKTCEPLPASFDFPKGDGPNCIALSEDENTMIAGSQSGKVYTWNIGGVTSAFLNELNGDDHSDPIPPDNGNNPYGQNFFRYDDPHGYRPLQSQSVPSLPVRTTRKLVKKRPVAPICPPRETAVSTKTGQGCLWNPRRWSISPNRTNETTHHPQDFFRYGDLHGYHSLPSQSVLSLPVKKIVKKRPVFPMHPPRETVASTATGRGQLWKPSRRSVSPNRTSETMHHPHNPPAAYKRPFRDVGYTQATATIRPTKPPSPESPREYTGHWNTVRTLPNFCRP